MTNSAKAAEAKTFMQLVSDVSDGRVKTAQRKISEQVETRKAHEAAKAPGNTSIQAKLTAAEKSLVEKSVAIIAVAAELDYGFLNAQRGEKTTARFNVYAIAKLVDIMKGVNSGHIRNAVNLCIVKSMMKFDEAGVDFTSKAAIAAVSRQVAVEPGHSKLLVRHTASPSTAPTQQSSTMNALRVIGAVENAGTNAKPVWKFTNNPIVDRLKEIAANPAPVAAPAAPVATTAAPEAVAA